MILDKAKALIPPMTDSQKFLARYLAEGMAGFTTGLILNATLLRPGGQYDKIKFVLRYLAEGTAGFTVGKFLNKTLLKPGDDPLLAAGERIMGE